MIDQTDIIPEYGTPVQYSCKRRHLVLIFVLIIFELLCTTYNFVNFPFHLAAYITASGSLDHTTTRRHEKEKSGSGSTRKR